MEVSVELITTLIIELRECIRFDSVGALLHEYRQHMKCPNTL